MHDLHMFAMGAYGVTAFLFCGYACARNVCAEVAKFYCLMQKL